MKSLTTLDLESSSIKELPSSIGRLRALEHLYLSSCKDLVNLPESICNLSSLKTLHVRDCLKLHGSKLDLGCDTPKPGDPLTTRQPTEFYLSHVMKHTRVKMVI